MSIDSKIVVLPKFIYKNIQNEYFQYRDNFI